LPKATHRIDKLFWHSDTKTGFPQLQEGSTGYRCDRFWCGETALGITETPKETHECFFLADLACRQLEALAAQPDRGPFHLRVDFWGPHQPFFPTKEFADQYDPKEIGEYPSFKDNLINQPKVFRMEASHPLTTDGEWIDIPSNLSWPAWQRIIARCYGHISMVDAAGGQIIEKIKELGLDENTLIIWTTDHGDALATHGGHFDKDSHMSAEVMHVPLAINWKGVIPDGIQDDHFVFTCDLPVTILDAAGLEFTDRVDGKSLLNLAIPDRGASDWRQSLMCETYGHGYGRTIIGRMVVDGHYKYVVTENDLEQLYDVKTDRFEMDNLAVKPEFNEVKRKMQVLLHSHQVKSEDPISLNYLLSTVIKG